MGKHGKVRQIVKAGIVVDQIPVSDEPEQSRSSKVLKDMARELVERTIVALHMIGRKEHLTGEDMDMLAKCVRLLNEFDDPSKADPGKPRDVTAMTDAELAKAGK